MKSSFDYLEDHRKLKKLIVESMSSRALKETIAYLNAEIFGSTEGGEAAVNPIANEGIDDLTDLVNEFNMVSEDEEEAPPTVDTPSPPNNPSQSASTSRRSPPNSSDPREALANSTTPRITDTSAVLPDKPPAPKRKKSARKVKETCVLESEGTQVAKDTRASLKKAGETAAKKKNSTGDTQH